VQRVAEVFFVWLKQNYLRAIGWKLSTYATKCIETTSAKFSVTKYECDELGISSVFETYNHFRNFASKVAEIYPNLQTFS